MADLGSKSALKTSIDGKIFTNTTFEVSAEDIRSSFEDTIDTLCGTVVTMASYGDLSTLVSSSSLEPGNIYVFPYETVSKVGNSSSALLNTAVPGYTPIVEQLAIVAKDSSSFFGQARSLNHPTDIITYDFTDDVESSTGTSRSGFIKYRKNVEMNVEACFDIRNNYVVRYGLQRPNVISPVAKNKGEIIYYDVSGSSVAAGWYFVNISATNIVADAEANADVLSPIPQVDENMYSSTSKIAETNIAIDGTTFAYHQSIDSLSKNVSIDRDATDVLVTNSSGIKIGQSVSKTVINSSSNTTIGASSFNIIIKGSSSVEVGHTCQNIFYFEGTAFKTEFLCRHILGIFAQATSVGSWSERVVSINGSTTNTVGASSAAIYFVKDASYNTVGLNGANITVFKGSNNSFEQNCSSIQIYGGSNNRFAQSCTLINMLGDRDEALGLGTSYVSPYSKMDNNTFGTSCENISFENIGGRGNTFGDECSNLVFTNTAEDATWRLVGCDFCRGIRNKTFKNILHGASFIVPNEVPTTITYEDWYVPQMFINTHTPDGTLYDADGTRMTTTGNWHFNRINPIVINYARANGFFDMDAPNEPGLTALQIAATKESIGRFSQEAADGTAYNPTKAELMLHGIGATPTNKAWQWTHNGYPLLINFMVNTNHQDSAEDYDVAGGGTVPEGGSDNFEDPTGDLNA